MALSKIAKFIIFENQANNRMKGQFLPESEVNAGGYKNLEN